MFKVYIIIVAAAVMLYLLWLAHIFKSAKVVDDKMAFLHDDYDPTLVP